MIDMGDNFRNCFHMQIQGKKKHEMKRMYARMLIFSS